jgi:hypothetical protein
VTERKLRYAERKRLAETGSLGDLLHDDVPQTFRNALWYLVYQPDSRARQKMLGSLDLECRAYFGWSGNENIGTHIAASTPDDLLSFIEILVEKASREWNNSMYADRWDGLWVIRDVETKINHLCERHRFGYRIEGGEFHRIGSPLLDVEIVGPTLLAVQRPGWEHVQRSYREALDHQRGGETDDALTAAHAAVEAALKAVGMTGQFSTMIKQFRNSALVPPYLAQTPEALESLLTLLGRSNAIRSSEGDAHGKAPGSAEVPQALANLAIHWAGAFIVYLAETAP